MSKINVLVVPSDRFGSGKFRSLDPHLILDPEEFFVDINYEPDWNDDEYFKKYQIIHLHRQILQKFWETDKIILRLQSMGIKVVMDTDDYWQIDTHHQNYKAFQKYELGKHIMAGIRVADVVTVPTTILADELKNCNVKNVVVIPNAINPNEEQFKPNPIASDKVRYGVLCGSSHLFDVELIRNISYPGQTFQTVLCGFDTRGRVQSKDPNTGEIKERPISPLDTVWFNYEIFLTDGYETIKNDQPYIEHLFKFKDEPYDDVNKPYRRIFTRPVNSYAKGYNNFDVLLSPLKDTKFNVYKSQLKAIEAGFMKKAIIASDYGPYKLDLINGKNALLVDVNKNHKQWKQYVEKLNKNPQMITDLSESLYETVKNKYDLNQVSKIRVDLYKSLVNE